MKNVAQITVLLGLILSSLVFGQTFTLTVQNQTLNGTEFIFDIYMLRTGGTPIYLGQSDFVLTFNEANFSSDAFTLVQQGDGSNCLSNPLAYPYQVSIVSSNRLIVNVNPPTITQQSIFDNYVQVISNSGNGEKIGTFKITTISNTSGTAGLQWRTSTPNKTIVNTLATSDPWKATDISSNGTYSNPSDALLPVQMTSLVATSDQKSGNITVTWHTEQEIGIAGFHVWRSENEIKDYYKISASLIHGSPDNLSANEYSFSDKNISHCVTYWYKIESISVDGSGEFFGPVSAVGSLPIPDLFGLSQNYPNPFNPETTINYQLPEDCKVTIRIYNLLGKEIKELVNDNKQAGYFGVIWNGKDSFGSAVSSGIYIIQIQAGSYNEIRKATILR